MPICECSQRVNVFRVASDSGPLAASRPRPTESHPAVAVFTPDEIWHLLLGRATTRDFAIGRHPASRLTFCAQTRADASDLWWPRPIIRMARGFEDRLVLARAVLSPRFRLKSRSGISFTADSLVLFIENHLAFSIGAQIERCCVNCTAHLLGDPRSKRVAAVRSTVFSHFGSRPWSSRPYAARVKSESSFSGWVKCC